MKKLLYILLLTPMTFVWGQNNAHERKQKRDSVANAKIFYYYKTHSDSIYRERSFVRAEKASFVPLNFLVVNDVTGMFFTESDGTTANINLGAILRKKNGNVITGSVALSSPISKNGITRPATSDGLASDGKITIGFQYKKWSHAPKEKQIINVLKEFGVEGFMDIKEKKDKIKALRKLNLGLPWFIGVTGNAGKQDVEYANDETLAIIEEKEKHSFVGSIYGGFYTGFALKTLVRFIVSYESYYKQNQKNEYLLTFNGGSSLIKRELAIGAPVKKSETLFRAELVKEFQIPVGINPSVTYRQNSSDVVIDIPIYLAQQQKEGKLLSLNGGIYFNYVSSLNKPFTMGVFIGTSVDELLGPIK
ncbi:MAG: hypothetical protein ACOYXT_19445 [Bacteroidota bacterium]